MDQNEPLLQLRARVKTLYKLSAELAKMPSFEAFCQAAVEEGRKRLNFDRLGLWFIDLETRTAHGTFGTDEFGHTRDEHHITFTFEQNDLITKTLEAEPGHIIEQGVLIEDFGQELRQGWRVIAALVDGDHGIGYLSADNIINQRPLTQEDVEILTLYGITIGHLANRKRAEDALQASEEGARYFHTRLKGLYEITAVLSKQANFDDLCYEAVKLGVEQLNFDRLGLWLYSESSDYLVGTFGIDEQGQIRDERGMQGAGKFPGFVEHLDGRVLISADRKRPLVNHQRDVVGYGQSAAARIWDGLHTLGWLSMDNLFTQRRITDYDLELLALYGTAIGHLIERHRMETESRSLAIENSRVHLLRKFIASLSHDFRTPLSVINSSLYLLQRSDDPQRREEKAQIIIKQTTLLEKYINDLLTISRLETLTSLNREPLDLNRLLLDIHTRAQRLAQQKNIRLCVEVASEALPILGNPGELLLAFEQLTQNGLEYTAPGGTVTLRTIRGDDHAILEVIDTGEGITEAHLPHIFEHFYRVDSARDPDKGGTGLGLPIARRIIELHFGWIEVESKLGEGSTFKVILPLAE